MECKKLINKKNNKKDIFVIKLPYEKLKGRAVKWNLELISEYEEYKNKHSILKWKCLECGHSFSDPYLNLYKRKSPCPNCKRDPRRYSKKLLGIIANDMSLELLLDYGLYKNNDSILEWKCLKCGYEFHDSIINIMRRKYPCQKCREEQRKEEKRIKLSIGYKECIRCKKVLHPSKFGEDRSYCKKCLLKLRVTRTIKKFKIIHEFFDGSCISCGLDLIWLPSFIFHHPYPDLKTAEWADIVDKPYKKIIEWVKNDKVFPLCRNCHELITTKYFEEFKDLILNPNLYLYSKNQRIDALRNRTNSIKIRFELKKWIRKRYIIEELFNGECIACKKVNIFNNLPALTFHHRDPSKKQNKLTNLLNLSCKKLYAIIIQEDIICLCGNCHSLIHSDYFFHIESALENLISNSSVKNVKLRLFQILNTLNEKVNSFRYTTIRIEDLF